VLVPKYPPGNTKTFSVVFPALGGVAQITVSVTVATDPERAIAVARQQIHACADQIHACADQRPTI
jgi:hypothetical protein